MKKTDSRGHLCLFDSECLLRLGLNAELYFLLRSSGSSSISFGFSRTTPFTLSINSCLNTSFIYTSHNNDSYVLSFSRSSRFCFRARSSSIDGGATYCVKPLCPLQSLFVNDETSLLLCDDEERRRFLFFLDFFCFLSFFDFFDFLPWPSS